MDKKIKYNNLIYYNRNCKLSPIKFIEFKSPMHIYNDKNMVKHQQKKQQKIKKKFKSKPNKVITENPKYRLKGQSDTIKN